MATVTYYLARTFKRGVDKTTIDYMRRTGDIKTSLLHDKETTIHMMVNIKGKLIKISSNERILPKYWDQRNRRAKSSYSDSVSLNLSLDRMKTNVLTALREAIFNRSKMNLV